MMRYPDIDPVALHLGPLQIHWYGIMYVIGFAAAWWLARRQAARPGSTWTAEEVDDLIFWAMLGVILGGRIGYVLHLRAAYQLSCCSGLAVSAQDLGRRHVIPRRRWPA